MRFRKFYPSLDDSARQKRNGHDGKYCVKPQQPAEAHFVPSLAAFNQSESLGKKNQDQRVKFWPSRRHCRESEKDRSNQAPENPYGTRDTETGERRVLCDCEGSEPAYRGQAREQDRFHHAGNIVLNLASLLPH